MLFDDDDNDLDLESLSETELARVLERLPSFALDKVRDELRQSYDGRRVLAELSP